MRGRHVRPAVRLADPAAATPPPSGRGGGGPAGLLALGIVALGGVGGWVVLGGWWGPFVGLLAGVWLARWHSRRPTAVVRARQRRYCADLPFAVDLLAAALRAGATPDAAARFVADAIGGPVGERLQRVDRALRLGAPPEQAWVHLGEPGGSGDGAAQARVLGAVRRSGHSGAALAGALSRVAEDLRSDAVLAAQTRAQTAGVLVVLPLGLCFLPAFVLTGLVPVIAAVLGGVLTGTPSGSP